MKTRKYGNAQREGHLLGALKLWSYFSPCVYTRLSCCVRDTLQLAKPFQVTISRCIVQIFAISLYLQAYTLHC